LNGLCKNPKNFFVLQFVSVISGIDFGKNQGVAVKSPETVFATVNRKKWPKLKCTVEP
jgi:hypothetical protein